MRTQANDRCSSNVYRRKLNNRPSCMHEANSNTRSNSCSICGRHCERSKGSVASVRRILRDPSVCRIQNAHGLVLTQAVEVHNCISPLVWSAIRAESTDTSEAGFFLAPHVVWMVDLLYDRQASCPNFCFQSKDQNTKLFRGVTRMTPVLLDPGMIPTHIGRVGRRITLNHRQCAKHC